MPKPGGTIYAIGAGGTSFVKIGSTQTSVEQRLRTFQTGQPFPLHILATVPVDRDVQRIERQVHAFLEAERRRGEWFDLTMDSAKLEALIVRAVTEAAGKPLALAMGRDRRLPQRGNSPWAQPTYRCIGYKILDTLLLSTGTLPGELTATLFDNV